MLTVAPQLDPVTRLFAMVAAVFPVDITRLYCAFARRMRALLHIWHVAPPITNRSHVHMPTRYGTHQWLYACSRRSPSPAMAGLSCTLFSTGGSLARSA